MSRKVYGKESVGLGVIGLGRLGHVHARNAATRINGARLAAVCDIDEQRAQTVAARFGCRWYTEIDAFLKDGGVDAVVVATPTGDHKGPVQAVAAAGKPLFCEKPLAATLTDNQQLVQTIREAAIPCQIGFNRRFDPDYENARRRISSGEIGEPAYYYGVSRDPFPPPPWACNPETGGGLLIDMLIHEYDAARFLMGSEIIEVVAREAALAVSAPDIPRFADNAVVMFTFASGALGSCHGSMHAEYGYDIRAEVYGSHGALQIGGLNRDQLVLCTKDRGITRPATFQWEGDAPHFLSRFRDAYERELLAFCDALIAGVPPLVDQDDALAAFQIAAAALESAGSGRPVRLK